MKTYGLRWREVGLAMGVAAAVGVAYYKTDDLRKFAGIALAIGVAYYFLTRGGE